MWVGILIDTESIDIFYFMPSILRFVLALCEYYHLSDPTLFDC